MPRESLDARQNLPKEAPRQVALGELQDHVLCVPEEAATDLEQLLLRARQRPALDGNGQDEAAQQVAQFMGDNRRSWWSAGT
jgi:hypothetical protein